MERDLVEAVASQRRMLNRLGREGAVRLGDDALGREYHQQERRVGAGLKPPGDWRALALR